MRRAGVGGRVMRRRVRKHACEFGEGGLPSRHVGVPVVRPVPCAAAAAAAAAAAVRRRRTASRPGRERRGSAWWERFGRAGRALCYGGEVEASFWPFQLRTEGVALQQCRRLGD